MLIGEKLRRMREMRRMTQRQVAEAMGTGQSAVSEWETQVSSPTVQSLERFALTTGFVMHVSFTPVELVDEATYPWMSKASYRGATFGHGPVEEES